MLTKFQKAIKVARSFARPALTHVPSANFARVTNWTLDKAENFKREETQLSQSEIFEIEDRASFTKFLDKKYQGTTLYDTLQNRWKHNLIRKAKRREKRLERAANEQPSQPAPPKLVVHSPLYTEIQINDDVRYNSFAVITLNGAQHKVAPDDMLVVNRLHDFKVGEVLAVDSMHIIGTKYFTILGRPVVTNCRVYLSVEQQTTSSKVIVFKKKRRKGYRKSMGFRALLTVLKVNKIEYDIDDEMASKAVKVWDN
jgi:large subunit ribosomal protein L21